MIVDDSLAQSQESVEGSDVSTRMLSNGGCYCTAGGSPEEYFGESVASGPGGVDEEPASLSDEVQLARPLERLQVMAHGARSDAKAALKLGHWYPWPLLDDSQELRRNLRAPSLRSPGEFLALLGSHRFLSPRLQRNPSPSNREQTMATHTRHYAPYRESCPGGSM